jgi:TRAP-type mannitol/chloroaromatic compound transport system permease small subunit
VVDEPAPQRTGIERALDRIVDTASWIWLALAFVIVLGVGLRTFFAISRIELEEMQWHLHAVGFLVGIVGCVLHDRHVRVDVFREGMTGRRRDWVDLYGLLLLQLPFLVLVVWSALPLVAASFATAERSTSAGGLPHRWLFKAALPASFLLLLTATLVRLFGVARRLFGRPRPADAPSGDPSA